MTRNKDLKARVRARMEKTGESYTAARAQLIKESTNAPRKFARGAQNYRHFGGEHAATAALCNMLASQGVTAPHTGRPYTEEFLLGIGGGIGAGYFLFQYKGTPPNFFFAGRHSWQDDKVFVEGILDRLGVVTNFQETGGAKGAQDKLDAALNEGKPALAWLDMYRLPGRGLDGDCAQHPVLVSLGNSYHLAVVMGGDEDGETYYLDDLSDKPIAVSKAALADARAGHKKFKNRLLTFAEAPGGSNLETAVRDAIGTCIEGLRTQRMKNFRLEAIETWAKCANDRKSKKGWPKVYGDNPFSAQVSTHAFIKHYGTGGDLFRSMYAEFLSESAEIVDRPALHAVAAQYDALGTQWCELADFALDEEHALFADARELLQEYWDLCGTRTESSGQVLARFGTRLVTLVDRSDNEFPLKGEELADFYDGMHRRLVDLHAAEDTALAALESAID